MTAQAAALSPRQIAARKAWETMRARKAAALAGTAAAMIATVSPVASVPASPPAIVNVSTDADFARMQVYVAPELVPVTDFQFVTINLLDHPVVGNGQREFVPVAMSAASVRLFYPPTLETITVARDTYDRGYRPVGSRHYSRARIAERIRRRIALADRVNGAAMEVVLQDGGAEAQRVLRMIGA